MSGHPFDWTGVQLVILDAANRVGGASWRQIKAAVTAEGWEPDDWLTQVRGPLQGLINDGTLRRVEGVSTTSESYELVRRTRTLGGLEFWLGGSPELKRNADGTIHEYVHPIPSEQKLNPYGAGPFCHFTVPAAPRSPGVYAIEVDGNLKYVGRTKRLLSMRFSRGDYGSITARNCHNDGQPTNCKMNSRILSIAKAGGTTQIWFHITSEVEAVEADLIWSLEPDWNDQRPSRTRAAIARTTGARRL